MLWMMPNAMASSGFHASWPISPGKIQAAQMMMNKTFLTGDEVPSKIIGCPKARETRAALLGGLGESVLRSLARRLKADGLLTWA